MNEIILPKSDIHEQQNELRRQYAVMKRYPGSTSWDEQKARKQAEIALNAALDVYPNGPRPDITLVQAHQIALGGLEGLREAA